MRKPTTCKINSKLRAGTESQKVRFFSIFFSFIFLNKCLGSIYLPNFSSIGRTFKAQNLKAKTDSIYRKSVYGVLWNNSRWLL